MPAQHGVDGVPPTDEVGRVIDTAVHPQVLRAFDSDKVLRDEDPTWFGATAMRQEAVPVGFEGGEVIGVLTRAVDLTHPRLPSPLELAYQDSADDLCQMVADGTFPHEEGNPRGLSTPRAGDGFIRLDRTGTVTYTSPNALSAFHRMGWTAELNHTRLSDVVKQLVTEPFEADDVAMMLDIAAGGGTGAHRPVPRHRHAGGGRRPTRDGAHPGGAAPPRKARNPGQLC